MVAPPDDLAVLVRSVPDLRLFRKVVHGIGFLQKGVAFVFFVGKYPLDRGGVPFRLAGGTEVAVRLKLAADAVGRRALKEKAGYFLYSASAGFTTILPSGPLS